MWSDSGSLSEKKPRLTVNSDINDISTSGGRGEHAGYSNTSSIVRVNVNGEVGILLANSTDEPGLGVVLFMVSIVDYSFAAIYDFSKKAVENGLDIFRVFDALNYIGTFV